MNDRRQNSGFFITDEPPSIFIIPNWLEKLIIILRRYKNEIDRNQRTNNNFLFNDFLLLIRFIPNGSRFYYFDARYSNDYTGC